VNEVIGDEDDVAIAAITAAELLVGVELADARRRSTRGRYVADILATIPVENYDLDVARAHARLLAHSHTSGTPRGAHDLIIAATALATDREVLTVDQPGFAGLPGVAVRTA
jgi:tRNA(fMet)-specific endonuclease VapC